MTPTATLPDNSAARASRFARVLPVAEIFSVKHIEVIGREAVATVVVGDAEHAPRTHGLRAPLDRWADIFAGLADDPVTGERFLELVLRARARAAGFAPPPPARVAARVETHETPPVPAPEVPPCADPDNAYYRGERSAVPKPSGGLL